MTLAATLAALHADLICRARECEDLARRPANPHREAEAAQAQHLRASAAELAALLGDRYPHIIVPDPAQLSLFSDGGPG